MLCIPLILHCICLFRMPTKKPPHSCLPHLASKSTETHGDPHILAVEMGRCGVESTRFLSSARVRRGERCSGGPQRSPPARLTSLDLTQGQAHGSLFPESFPESTSKLTSCGPRLAANSPRAMKRSASHQMRPSKAAGLFLSRCWCCFWPRRIEQNPKQPELMLACVSRQSRPTQGACMQNRDAGQRIVARAAEEGEVRRSVSGRVGPLKTGCAGSKVCWPGLLSSGQLRSHWTAHIACDVMGFG